MVRALSRHRRSGERRRRPAAGLRQACAGEPGREPRRAFRLDRTRGEPTACRDCRQLPGLPPLAVREPPNVERAKITADRITRDANSAADVISRIRAFFSRVPQAESSEDVNHLISEVCRLMANEIASKSVRIETKLAPDLPPVGLDRVQVQQVFMNLVRNGIEAMDTVVDRARALHIRSSCDGFDAIRIEVRDSGAGFKDVDRSSSRSTRPSSTEWAWGSPSADRSSSRMAAGSGRPTARRAVRWSPSPSRCRRAPCTSQRDAIMGGGGGGGGGWDRGVGFENRNDFFVRG